jgi:hypothetical protein
MYSIENTSIEKSNTNIKKKKDINNCQELKNITYKTMLLNGNNLNSKTNETIDKISLNNYLETESTASRKENWSKLDKTEKIKKLNTYSDTLASKYVLTDEELINLKNYLIKCLDRKCLLRSKEISYNKDTNTITNIPYLHFNKETRNFILKKDDKHVSTIKCLPQDKKTKSKTIKIQ